MSTFDVAVKLKPGDVFYETGYGEHYKMTVVSPPEVITGGDNDQVIWTAMGVEGFEQEYLITKGLEHYGPRIRVKE